MSTIYGMVSTGVCSYSYSSGHILTDGGITMAPNAPQMHFHLAAQAVSFTGGSFIAPA